MSRMPGKTKLLASCLLAGLMTLTGCTVTTPYPVVKEPPSPVVNRPAVARKPVLALALVVGAIYASGLRGDALRQAAEKVEQTSITDWQLPLLNRGVLRGVSLERFINEQVGNRNIQSMPMRLGSVATDLQSGEGILFRSGNTGQAVRASSAVPGVFEPVRIGTRDYVDGGLVAPVPVLYARQMGADVVVAIDISSKPGDAATTGQLQVLMQTFTIMGKTISKFELTQADVVLRPQLAGMSSADFSNRQKSIEAGRAAMQQALPQIRAALQPKR